MGISAGSPPISCWTSSSGWNARSDDPHQPSQAGFCRRRDAPIRSGPPWNIVAWFAAVITHFAGLKAYFEPSLRNQDLLGRWHVGPNVVGSKWRGGYFHD